MEALRTFLNGLKPPEQRNFAERCGTTIGYLRKVISAKKRIGASLVILIERESSGRVRCEDLRPDVDWRYVRGASASVQPLSSSA